MEMLAKFAAARPRSADAVASRLEAIARSLGVTDLAPVVAALVTTMRYAEAMSNVDLSQPCEHVAQVKIHTVKRPARGCDECMKIGGQWVHLRECLVCGQVGCCDNSPNQHATKHFHATKHPIISSAEPEENWCWCYVDERVLG